MRLRWLATATCVLLAAGACGTCTASRAVRPARIPTLPPPSVDVQLLVDGKPVTGAASVHAGSVLRLAFTSPQRPIAVKVALGGTPLARQALTWSADLRSVEVPLDGLLPYQPVQLVVSGGLTVRNPNPLQLTPVATIPANTSTGVQAGFQPRSPLEIVVENSGPARPQSGLQDADVVYEYLSEYSTTRMTAIYFNRIPDTVGPVRSCRMINPYIGYAYVGMTMCTGVSDGTARYIFGAGPDARLVPDLMEPYDRGGHFYRVGFRAVPHNAYTSGDRAGRLRSEWSLPVGDYAVDPPHDDLPAGQPADAPAVPLHGVTYAYDAGSRQYLRFDHGVPFGDQDTGQQVHVKSVVLMHVPFHDAGWVEDENGGAHSVWYHMLGTGAAEVYSDGAMVQATWHMGSSENQPYYDNHTPVWFTDPSGAVLRLNSGLTWIHVVGNGQERCPDSPSACG